MKSATKSSQATNTTNQNLVPKLVFPESISRNNYKSDLPLAQYLSFETTPIIDKNHTTTNFGFGTQVAKFASLKEKSSEKIRPSILSSNRKLTTITTTKPSKSEQASISHRISEVPDYWAHDVRAQQSKKVQQIPRMTNVPNELFSPPQSNNVSMQAIKVPKFKLEKLSFSSKNLLEPKRENDFFQSMYINIEKKESLENRIKGIAESEREVVRTEANEARYHSLTHRKLKKQRDNWLGFQMLQTKKKDTGITAYLMKALSEVSGNINQANLLDTDVLPSKGNGGLEVQGQRKPKCEEKLAKFCIGSNLVREWNILPPKMTLLTGTRRFIKKSPRESAESSTNKEFESGKSRKVAHERAKTIYSERRDFCIFSTEPKEEIDLNIKGRNTEEIITEQARSKEIKEMICTVKDQVQLEKESKRGTQIRKVKLKKKSLQINSARQPVEITDGSTSAKKDDEQQDKEYSKDRDRGNKVLSKTKSLKKLRETVQVFEDPKRTSVVPQSNAKEERRTVEHETVVKETKKVKNEDCWIGLESDEDYSLDEYLRNKDYRTSRENFEYDYATELKKQKSKARR